MSVKVLDYLVDEYKNELNDTVFEISGTEEEMKRLVNKLSKEYTNTLNKKIEVSDGREYYIKRCQAIVNIIHKDKLTTVKIITSKKPVEVSTKFNDAYRIYQ